VNQISKQKVQFLAVRSIFGGHSLVSALRQELETSLQTMQLIHRSA